VKGHLVFGHAGAHVLHFRLMQQSPERRAHKTPLPVLLSLVIGFLLGILLVIFSALKIGRNLPYVGFIAPDLWHDLGIAFLVSSAVASLFEIYRSAKLQMESMRDVINSVMGELVTADVWMEVKDLMEQKRVIRRDVRFRLEFVPAAGLLEHECVLKVEHEYNLYSLRNRKLTLPIEHDLDYQFANESLRLPRWESAIITPEEAKVRPGESIDVSNPGLRIDVNLAPRAAEEPVFVRTERQEIVHVPGSYNIYTTEFMKGLHLSVHGCRSGFHLEVWVRPHGGGHALPERDHSWSYDQIIFPGQGIEIKFISDERSSAPQPPAASTASLLEKIRSFFH
jgi:hypothetical protein